MPIFKLKLMIFDKRYHERKFDKIRQCIRLKKYLCIFLNFGDWRRVEELEYRLRDLQMFTYTCR